MTFKMVWSTDWHVADNAPENRTDDYTETCFNKIEPNMIGPCDRCPDLKDQEQAYQAGSYDKADKQTIGRTNTCSSDHYRARNQAQNASCCRDHIEK